MLVNIADDYLVHRALTVQLIGLVEHAKTDATPARHAPRIRFEGAREQPQQGGFAVAVSTDNADAITLVDANGNGIEDDASGVFEVQRLSAEKVGHIPLD